MNPLKHISLWCKGLAAVFANTLRLITHDMGVLIFVILLPLAYPVVYTLVYNPEVIEKVPVAVVDDCRTAQSRQFIRDAGAAPSIDIYDYCSNMADAKRLMDEGKVHGIFYIPRDYGRNYGRMERSNVTFFCDMSLLLRYRALSIGLADVQIKTMGDITAERLDMLGDLAPAGMDGLPIQEQSHMLGDTQQGFASFVMPGIVVLILQQSMFLGIAMLAGTSRQRRRANGGRDPQGVDWAPASATVLGQALAFFVIYIAPTIFVLHYIPQIFNLPHAGAAADYLLFIVPMLLASAFFALTWSALVTDRESTFMVVVFTSAVFLFLSGLTWPRYAMPQGWQVVGDLIPATWGVEGFIRINSNASTLAQNTHPYMWNWLLTAAYFVCAWAVACWYKRGARTTLLNKRPIAG